MLYSICKKGNKKTKQILQLTCQVGYDDDDDDDDDDANRVQDLKKKKNNSKKQKNFSTTPFPLFFFFLLVEEEEEEKKKKKEWAQSALIERCSLEKHWTLDTGHLDTWTTSCPIKAPTTKLR